MMPVAERQLPAATHQLSAVVFRNNRMLNGFKVGRNTVAVDAEIGGSGLGNVNVHVKGAGKTMLTSIDDMANLPRRIRENPTVSKAIAKGFEWLSKVGK